MVGRHIDLLGRQGKRGMQAPAAPLPYHRLEWSSHKSPDNILIRKRRLSGLESRASYATRIATKGQFAISNPVGLGLSLGLTKS